VGQFTSYENITRARSGQYFQVSQYTPVSDGFRSHPNTFSKPKDGLLSHPDSIFDSKEINFVSSSSSVVLFRPFEEVGTQSFHGAADVPDVLGSSTHSQSHRFTPKHARDLICDSTPKHISAVQKYSVFFSPGDATRTGESHGGDSLCRGVGIGVVGEHSSNGAELHKKKLSTSKSMQATLYTSKRSAPRQSGKHRRKFSDSRRTPPVGALPTIHCPQDAPFALSAHALIRLSHHFFGSGYLGFSSFIRKMPQIENNFSSWMHSPPHE